MGIVRVSVGWDGALETPHPTDQLFSGDGQRVSAFFWLFDDVGHLKVQAE